VWTWDEAFRVVCGEIGLAPSEFYALQYSELALILKGYADRMRSESRAAYYRTAWLIHWLLIPHQKKDAELLTPERILGRAPKSKGRRFRSDEEAALAFVNALKKKSKQKKTEVSNGE
jgi:hypothetical protein